MTKTGYLAASATLAAAFVRSSTKVDYADLEIGFRPITFNQTPTGAVSVDDCDAMAAKMSELGGTVMVPPTDIEPGRFAMGFDPQGAAFSVIRMGH